MAYLKIFCDATKRQIGEMRIIDNQNVVFDMKGNKVGFCIVTDYGEKYTDLNGNIVYSVEELLLKN